MSSQININATNFFINIFTNLRRPKLQPKVWIKFNELNKYLRIVIWLTSNQRYKNDLETLLTRVKRLVKRSGWDFTFSYLKESLRLLIRALSGSPETKYLNGIIVSRDSHGLPSMIPLNLRKLCLNWREDLTSTRSLLTFLSIFRVFPTKVKPKLDTITQPFTGMGLTLSNLEEAVLEVFGRSGIKLISPKLIKLETAGPNAVKSAWGSSLDALAFINYPKEFINFSRYCIHAKAVPYLIWCCWLIFIGFIPYTILVVCGYMKPLKLGKLGVVYDQAGKARVIAICSYWIQLVLKPLHNSLFKTLKRIKTDGTFDQHAPLQLLIEAEPTCHKFSCFDLSAATDRLPIKIQQDILNIASKSKLGDLWSSLLGIDWYYKNKPVRYSVGQPMGAYSSWGMLAVTHHVIVRYSALRCGIKNFNSYAVLGDDIVIKHDEVAAEYLRIMQYLGVAINLNKSIVSSDFAEFAKVWRGPDVDITPIGPGLILRACRNNIYKGILLGEAYKLNLIQSLSQLLTLIRDLNNPFLALWSTLGVGSDKWRNQADASAIAWGISSTHDPKLFLYCLMNAVKQQSINDWKESKLQHQREKETFYNNWWKVYSSSNWPSRVLEALLKLMGPGFWIYAFSFMEMDDQFDKSPPIHTYVLKDLSSIRDMVNLDPLLSLSSIDWREKKKVIKYGSKANQIAHEFDRTMEEMRDFSEML